MKKQHMIAVLCLVGFIGIMLLVLFHQISWFDESVYHLIYGNHNKLFDNFFIHFTKIGNTLPTIIIAGIIILLFRQRKDQAIVASSLASTVGLNQLIKHIIRRPRPPMDRRLIRQGGYSFPSGHSMAALCVYGVLIYFCFTKIKNKKLKIACISLLTLMILLIGISRIYVGVHYPSDVLGGYLLSIGILIIDISITNHLFKGE